MKNILLIDDEINIGQLLSKFLSKNGFSVSVATSGLKASEIFEHEFFDLVLCDFRLEDTDGKEMLTRIKKRHPETLVIIITGYSDVKLAVELIKNGAYDYISKPLYPDEILATIQKALASSQDISLNPSIATPLKTSEIQVKNPKNNHPFKDGFLKGESPIARELYRQIDLVSPTNYSVILFGESGTGKESVAQRIHAQSTRKNAPFIAMDCGSLSKELATSELFGHEKGSFTGAIQTKVGHFEMANYGTLFLDEVANLSYDIQIALLRVVQERKVKRIGSTKEIMLDVRLIVASNENLWDAVSKGKFREDLYHRFNEFSIVIPPLRGRGNDLFLFANYFLEESSKELGKPIKGFNSRVLELFSKYSWPGNIRELKNVIRRAALLTENNASIEVRSLPLEIAEGSFLAPFGKELTAVDEVSPFPKNNLKNAALEAEYETILQVLRQVNFNKTKAAKLLNIDRKTLYNKMKAINPDL